MDRAARRDTAADTAPRSCRGREELWARTALRRLDWYVAERAPRCARSGAGARRGARPPLCAGAPARCRRGAGSRWRSPPARARATTPTGTLAAERAASCDPTLPEAPYCAGSCDWRAGTARRGAGALPRRGGARLDRSRAGARAGARAAAGRHATTRCPSSFLTGARAVALLTSRRGRSSRSSCRSTAPAAVIAPARVPLAGTWMVRWKRVRDDRCRCWSTSAAGERWRTHFRGSPRSEIPAPSGDRAGRLAAASGASRRRCKSGVPRRSWAVDRSATAGAVTRGPRATAQEDSRCPVVRHRRDRRRRHRSRGRARGPARARARRRDRGLHGASSRATRSAPSTT